MSAKNGNPQEENNSPKIQGLTLFGQLIIVAILCILVLNSWHFKYSFSIADYILLALLLAFANIDNVSELRIFGAVLKTKSGIKPNPNPPEDIPVEPEERLEDKETEQIAIDLANKFEGSDYNLFFKDYPSWKIGSLFSKIEKEALEYLFISGNSKYIPKNKKGNFEYYPQVVYDDKLTGIQFDGIYRVKGKRIWIEMKIYRKKITTTSLREIVETLVKRANQVLPMFRRKNEFLLVFVTYNFGHEYERRLFNRISRLWPSQLPTINTEILHFEDLFDLQS